MKAFLSMARYALAALFLCVTARGDEIAPEINLLQGVTNKNIAAVQQALEQGAPVDCRSPEGRTPLILAAHAGSLEIAKMLVTKGAEVNAKTTTEVGSTVLSFAVESRNAELVEYLIAHGAKPDGRGRNGEAPLHFAAATGLADMVKVLLKNGANIEQTNNIGDTPLMIACKRKSAEMVAILLENGAKIDATGPHGHTPLIYAGYHGQVEIVRLLLNAGADPLATATDDPDPEAQDGRYDAADLAQMKGHLEAAKLILQAQEQALKARRKRQMDVLS